MPELIFFVLPIVATLSIGDSQDDPSPGLDPSPSVDDGRALSAKGASCGLYLSPPKCVRHGFLWCHAPYDAPWDWGRSHPIRLPWLFMVLYTI